jgi:integrase
MIQQYLLVYSEYLTDVWLKNKSDLGCQTLKNYLSYINLHTTPSIGHYSLAKLNPIIIQNLITDLKRKGLADGTVKRIYSIIQQTISHDGKELRPQAKTKTSIRSVAISPETIAALKKHRNLIEQEKTFLGSEYKDHDLVICTSLGTPVIPRHINKVWDHFHAKIDVPKITFHDLRHTHASLLLKQGTHPKIVSERLGHSSIQMTLDTYTHLLPNMQEAAASGLDQMLK